MKRRGDNRLRCIAAYGGMKISMENFKQEINLLKSDILQAMKDEGRNTRDFVSQEIRASEHRTKTELREEFNRKLDSTKNEIIEEVTEFVGERILPLIDDHERRIVRLETKNV